MSVDFIKLTEGVRFLVRTPSGSNSTDWMLWQREVNSVLGGIRLKNIKVFGNPAVILNARCEGIYGIAPRDCEIDYHFLRDDQSLMVTQETKFDDRVELLTRGFALPIKITVYYKGK
jgi:hypothetical protein